MNCPIRTDPAPDEGHNQNPSDMANEISTQHSLNHRRNSTQRSRSSRIDLEDGSHDAIESETTLVEQPGAVAGTGQTEKSTGNLWTRIKGSNGGSSPATGLTKLKKKLVKYSKFVGPGFMVSVAYIDPGPFCLPRISLTTNRKPPGNYATDVAAGASYKYRLLFMILLSNIFAIFLQTLCVKLGTVTGINLAENCKAHLPRWLNLVLYFFAESAIIATDVAEVIGTAIALNVLLHIPLVAGCAISILDVLIILLFYNPSGMSMRALRIFELGVALLVVGVVVCFCYQLSLLEGVNVGEVFKGYLPSSALIESKG